MAHKKILLGELWVELVATRSWLKKCYLVTKTNEETHDETRHTHEILLFNQEILFICTYLSSPQLHAIQIHVLVKQTLNRLRIEHRGLSIYLTLPGCVVLRVSFRPMVLILHSLLSIGQLGRIPRCPNRGFSAIDRLTTLETSSVLGLTWRFHAFSGPLFNSGRRFRAPSFYPIFITNYSIRIFNLKNDRKRYVLVFCLKCARGFFSAKYCWHT